MNVLYDHGRESFLRGEISWNNDDIRILLVDLGLYIPDFANDKFLSDIPIGAIVAASGPLTTKTTLAGTAGSDGVIYPSVTGASVEAVVGYQHTGVSATSRLIEFWDTAPGLPLPVTSNANVAVSWPVGPGNQFTL